MSPNSFDGGGGAYITNIDVGPDLLWNEILIKREQAVGFLLNSK